MACRDVNQSAIAEVRDQLFLDRADDIRLNVVTGNLGLDRPTGGTDDDEWRALAKAVALQHKQVRNIFYRLLEICVGPQKTRVAYPSSTALVNDTIVTVDNPDALIQVGTLIFDPGQATAEEVDFCFRDLVSGKVYLSKALTLAHASVAAATGYIAALTAAGATSLVLTNSAEFPTTGYPYSIIVDEGTLFEEILVVSNNNTGTNTLTLVDPTTKDHQGPKAKGFIRRPLILATIPGRDFLKLDTDATRVFPATGWVRIDFGEVDQEVIEYRANNVEEDILYTRTPLVNAHAAAASVEYVTPGAKVRTAPVIQQGIPWSVHETEPRKVKICLPEEILERRLLDASYLHMTSPDPASTTTTASAVAGDTILEVASTAGFQETTGAILVDGSRYLQYAAIVDATHFRLTFGLDTNLSSGATVVALTQNYGGTDLEEGNLRLADGTVNQNGVQWPGPYIYDVLQAGVSDTRTTLTQIIPPPAQVMVTQTFGRTSLEVDDLSLWPTAPFPVRVGHRTGFAEDLTCTDVILRKDAGTTVTGPGTINSIPVADTSTFPPWDSIHTAGYRILVGRGTPNEEILTVDEVGPSEFTFLFAAEFIHDAPETVELLHDVLKIEPVLALTHRGPRFNPTRVGHRVDVLHESISVGSTTGFEDTGNAWFNFGYNRPAVRTRITNVVSPTVLEFDDSSVFPTTDFPYQITVGEGLAPEFDELAFLGGTIAQERRFVIANNTGTNELTLSAALDATHVAGEYVEFNPGVPTTVAYRALSATELELEAETVFDNAYTIGETVMWSPGPSLPSEYGTDYPFRLPPSPVACVANMVDLVRAAGVEVFLLEDCKKLAPPEEEEEEPEPEPEPEITSMVTMANTTDQLSMFLSAATETILATGFGPYFHALVDWDSIPGTEVAFHMHMSVSGGGASDTVFRVRVGTPTPDAPDDIVGSVVLTWTGTTQPNSSAFITKPTGLQMLTVTAEDPDGALLTFLNPVLYIESNIGARAMLLHGPYPPILPATSQINNWVIDFDWFQAATIKVAMAALTKTNLVPGTATMEAKIGGTIDSQGTGTVLHSYSILTQSPLDEFLPTGSVAVVANPGGVQLVKWAVTGHAQTEARYKSILLVGQ